MKLLTVVVLMTIEFTCAVHTQAASADVPHRRSRRVVGGHTVDVEQFPYLVSIRRKGSFQCGGSLVTSRCVLTAAHCIKDGRANEFTVRGGATYLNEKSNNSRRVSKMIMHSKFNRRTFESDVAIFQLDGELQGEHIQTIALSDKSPMEGDFVRIVGWGLTNELQTKPSNQMRTAHLQVWPQRECRRLYADYRNVTSSMFCASIPGERDACQADSGGPAILDDRLVGIVSWGRGYECGRRDSPGVYASVSRLRLWIKQVISKYC